MGVTRPCCAVRFLYKTVYLVGFVQKPPIVRAPQSQASAGLPSGFRVPLAIGIFIFREIYNCAKFTARACNRKKHRTSQWAPSIRRRTPDKNAAREGHSQLPLLLRM